MNTLASWNGEPIAPTDALEQPTMRLRWKSVYIIRLLLAVGCAISLTVLFRMVDMWNLMAMDNNVEARSHIQEEITHWISQRPSSSEKAYVVACGSIQRGFLQSKSWVEAMVDDPGKPVNARLSICRFTLDPSGRIIDVVEKSMPSDVPR